MWWFKSIFSFKIALPLSSFKTITRGYSSFLISKIIASNTLSEEDKKYPHFFIHYEREKALYSMAAPVYPDFAPEVAVLDGGEYSGGLDWLHLDKTNLKYLCLDDTNTHKNREVIRALDSQWRLLSKGEDRNGWAIYSKNP